MFLIWNMQTEEDISNSHPSRGYNGARCSLAVNKLFLNKNKQIQIDGQFQGNPKQCAYSPWMKTDASCKN